MADWVVETLTNENFRPDSLDDFVRTQRVTESYRLTESGLQLVPDCYVDDWSPARKREKAAELLREDCVAYLVRDGRRVVGFVLLEKALRQGRMVVRSLHVSQDYRRRGIGRRLFERAVRTARAAGARELYISANSSRETIGFYRAMRCELACPVIRELAEEEPFDLQMTRALGGD